MTDETSAPPDFEAPGGPRARRAQDDTQILLACLEAYSSAPTPKDAVSALFYAMRLRLDVSFSVIVAPTDTRGELQIVATDKPTLLNAKLTAPFDIWHTARALPNVRAVEGWDALDGFREAAGAIVAPGSQTHALIACRAAPRSFAPRHVRLIEQLAGLAVQALRTGELMAENALLAATISGSSAGFAISDATEDGQPLVYVNRAFEKISGYTAAEVVGQNCRFLSAEPPNSPERLRLRAAVAARQGGTFVLRNRRKSGQEFWNELTLYPVEDRTGRVRNMVATQTDVTARMAAAEERDIVRRRMDRALTATNDAYLVLEADDSVAFANAAVHRFFPSPQLKWRVGTHFDENWEAYLAGAEAAGQHVSRLLRAANHPGLEFLPDGQELILPDGRAVLVRGKRLDDRGRVLTATDVTAMKSAQNLLADRLTAMEAAPDGIATTDPLGRLTYLNSAALSLLGFEREAQATGTPWRDRYDGAGTAVATAGGSGFEVTLTRSAAADTHTHEIVGSPLPAGGTVLAIRDITEKLALEERENDLTRELIRLQRQDAVAQLTAGVAHDFNNLLSAINGSATLIGMSGPLPEAARPHLDRIAAAGAQSAKLVARLLDVGAGENFDGLFAFSDVLDGVPSLVSSSLPEAVTLHMAPARGPMTLQGDPSSLSRILINLILNARDAIGAEGGTITVTAADQGGLDGAMLLAGQIADETRYAKITVADTGGGIDAAQLADITKPYFTTKGRQGTGLGLATSAMQIQAAGGAMAVQSDKGAGTRFALFWPLHRGAPRPAVTDDAAPADQDLSGRTILIVDDEDSVSEVLASYLERQGAEVATCSDPRDAQAAIRDDPGAWSALITDYDMPALSGGALVAALRPIAPDLPIIVVTALAKRLTDPRVGPGTVTAVFAKPVDLAALSETLAQVTAKA
ncbi:MAG: PAS domain-containing protein [Pseudomonadota bacterium]